MAAVNKETPAVAGGRPNGAIDINAAICSILDGLPDAVTDDQASETGVPHNGYRRVRIKSRTTGWSGLGGSHAR